MELISQTKTSSALFLKTLLFFSILFSGFCGIIAELSLFNLANNLIGSMNIVLTYTMGVMLFFMGIGALVIRYKEFQKNLIRSFIIAESVLSGLVGTSVFVIYYLSAIQPELKIFWVLGYSALIGFFIGFEIPLILLINEKLKQPLADNSSAVLFADYLGSLIAFILFSHFFLTHLGLAKSALMGALINCFVALITFLVFKKYFSTSYKLVALPLISLILLIAATFQSNNIMSNIDVLHYRDGIVFKKQTKYQKLVVTWNGKMGNPRYNSNHQEKPLKTLWEKEFSDSLFISLKKFKSLPDNQDLRLFINGGLQFSTLDEAYYHEALVHPAVFLLQGFDTLNVLFGGGGDGLGIREVLKYPQINQVQVVDLDPGMTDLFTREPIFCALNDSSFHDPRVQIINEDFMTYLNSSPRKYDLIILDFPDPHHDEVAKLYSLQFYQLIKNHLSDRGVLVTQSTSPFYNQEAFLIIHKTLNSIFPGKVLAYKIPMKTFGLWGFQMVHSGKTKTQTMSKLESFEVSLPLEYINQEIVQASYRWPRDTWKFLDKIQTNSLWKPTLTKAFMGSSM